MLIGCFLLFTNGTRAGVAIAVVDCIDSLLEQIGHTFLFVEVLHLETAPGHAPFRLTLGLRVR